MESAVHLHMEKGQRRMSCEAELIIAQPIKQIMHPTCILRCVWQKWLAFRKCWLHLLSVHVNAVPTHCIKKEKSREFVYACAYAVIAHAESFGWQTYKSDHTILPSLIIY